MDPDGDRQPRADAVAAVVGDGSVVGWEDEAHAQMLLAGLLEASEDPLFIKDDQLRFIVVNRASARAHHFDRPADMLGRRDAEMLTPDIARLVEGNDRAVIASGHALETYGHLDTPDGRRLFATRRTPLRGPGGEVIGVLGTARDITDQRRAEEALATSEERYRAIVESTSSIVWVTDEQGHVAEETPGWSAFTGQSYGEYHADGWLTAIHLDDRDELLGVLHATHERDGLDERFELRCRLWSVQHQAHRHVVTRGILRHDALGRPLEWLCIALDVEDQHRRDLILRRHQDATAGLVALGARLAAITSFHEVVCAVPTALQTMLGAVNVHIEASVGSWPSSPGHSSWLQPPTSDERIVGAVVRTQEADARGLRVWSSTASGNRTVISGIAVSIASSDRVVGSIAVLWSTPTTLDGAITDSIVAAAQMVGDALHRASQHDEEHRFAEQFQRAILQPLRLPAEYEVASRYLPAAATMQMGGDWFDTVQRPCGRAAVVIGDVAGHGAAAAADMADMRAIVSTLLALDLSLPDIMNMTSDLISRQGEDRLASALVLELDPRLRTLTHLSAGHPPFLLHRPDDGVVAVEAPRRPVLGIPETRQRAAHTMPFGEGDLVVAFTDGLIEHRDRPLDAMIAHLANSLAEHHSLGCETLVDALIDEVAPTRLDDVAIVAVRFAPR